MKRPLISLMLIFLFGRISLAQTIPPDSLYLGQTPPGNIPQVFAPGIVSVSGRVEYGISIAPAGDEMIFAIGDWPDKRTMVLDYKNNHWLGPDTISFSMSRSADEAIYSPDGQRIYYYAYNPPNPVGGADLCYSIKPDSVWSEPINLGSQLNTSQDEYHPCVVADTSIYFENVSGKLCYSKYQNGAYQPRVVLPAIFNDPNMAWGNPYVAPDESYFIFNSSRPGGFGSSDLYIAYKKVDGTWTNPKNLGNIINTPTYECGSEITDDNLFMTYVSNNDIYWVGTSFIDSLKYTNYTPYLKNKIPDQNAYVGYSFTYTIPDSTFYDDDGNNTLSYSATLSNGSPLPSWLTFDTITATFSGLPPSIQSILVRVKATDTAGAAASGAFKIKVLEPTSLPSLRDSEIRIFPNPSNGVIKISQDIQTDNQSRIEVYDPLGKVILKNNFKEFLRIDLSDQPKGIYLIKLIRNNQSTVRKICIQ
ncbi:MAG: T9SS type A sorting domain-containing protein [Bacteroidetes bacterium]|nr:T9SS type A sorting domain-containing protein [Bacteroidota bacterium]